MLVIGLTGPTGAGKTTALQELARLGGDVIDCDRLYHEMLESNIALQGELEQAFGDLTGENGRFERKRLGEIVFHDPAALARLDHIVRPHIVRAVKERICTAKGTAVAVDGITLIETGLCKLCDVTVAVLAPVEDRVRRICRREGIEEQYARARVASQKEDRFYLTHCDYSLINDCADASQFALRARELFSRLLAQEQPHGGEM